jgi:mannosyl-oligosaccharide alpha-1,2-mannosidase
VEFTRLAQITREPKYFDAIQRITNELEKFQDKTKLPGMWPKLIDASGCLTQYSSRGNDSIGPDLVGPPTDGNRQDELREGQKLSEDLADVVGAKDVKGRPKNPPAVGKPPKQDIFVKPIPIKLEPAASKPGTGGTEAPSLPASAGKTEGHELGWGSDGKEHPQRDKRQIYDNGQCVPQGLESPPPPPHKDWFTLGALSDSLYEYFPKVGIYGQSPCLPF